MVSAVTTSISIVPPIALAAFVAAGLGAVGIASGTDLVIVPLVPAKRDLVASESESNAHLRRA